MKIKVLYHSSTGNTGKLAHAIADAVGVQAESIGDGAAALPESVDLLFLGDGVYAGKPSKAMLAFIERLDAASVKSAAIFATYGAQETIGTDMAKMLGDRGIKVIGEPFTCKGKAWLIMNRKHPCPEELDKARAFAKNIVAKAGR